MRSINKIMVTFLHNLKS